ncbi:MAG: hypothetical protein R3B13_19170 [Polyangiaceae bacterium]
MFYVWSPTAIGKTSFEFVLTSLEADGVSSKVKPFAQEIAAALGMREKVAKATLAECRSNYFTDYPDEDWQSVWQPAWQWHVEFQSSVDRWPKLKTSPWIACEGLSDENFDYGEHSWATDFARKVDALVVADFKTESKLEAAQSAIVASSKIAGLAANHKSKSPTFRVASALGAWRQLQVNLGSFPGSFFEAPDLVGEVCELLKKKGGHVHHAHLI